MAADGPLRLGAAEPLGRGTRRLVFQHPQDPDALVKVLNASRSAVERVSGRYKSWSRRLGLAGRGAVTEYRRELDELSRLRARLGWVPGFVADARGIVQTDRGPGLVVEKLRGRDGGLAPTLDTVLRSRGLTSALAKALEELAREIEASGVVLNNLSTRNIVVAWDPRRGERLVLVDCLGAKTLVPVHRMSRRLNRYAVAKHLRGLMARVDQTPSREEPA